jgi:DNA primase
MTKTKYFEKHGAGTSEPRNRFTRQAERLLREVPIVKVIGEYTPLRKTRKGLTGNCPRHDDPKHTLRIDSRASTFSCFFCGIGGDAITFLETVEELTYGQALEALEKINYADEYRDTA